MTRPVSHLSRGRVAAAVIASLILATSCGSSDSDATDAPADDVDVEPSGESTPDPQEPADTDSDDVATSDVDCQALLEARPGLVSAGNLLLVADDQETIDAMFGADGLDQVAADVALFRPYQDVEGEVFGTLRPGLDNLENDLAAIRDGRLDERVGDYGLVAIVPVLEAIGC